MHCHRFRAGRRPTARSDSFRNSGKIRNLLAHIRQENQRNKSKQFGSTSQFKGVCYDPRRRKWYARYRVGGKRPRLGPYASEVDAARIYDLAAVRW